VKLLEKKIDVTGQMILAAIPMFVTPLYAFYRVKKFKKGLLVMFLVLGIVGVDSIIHASIATSEMFEIKQFQREMIISYSYVFSLIITMLIPMYFARKWTIGYNNTLD